MKKPLLSIVIPIYNTGKTARSIIDKVLKQPIKDIELVLVNDGSQDDSLEHLNKIKKKDQRVKVINQKNGGPAAARNTGIKNVSGKYLMFLDSDDDIDSSMITKMTERIEATNSDLVVCRILQNHIKNGKVISSVNVYAAKTPKPPKNNGYIEYILRLLGNDGRLYHPCNKIFRLDIIDKYNIHFEPGLDFGEDLTFNLEYMKRTKKIEFIEEPLYIYNFGTDTSVVGKSSLIYENRQKNYREILKFIGNDPSQKSKDLAGWIKYYWFYSFTLAVCSSPLGLRQRLSLIRQANRNDTFIPAENPKNISKNKYRMERIFGATIKIPLLFYLIVRISNSFKNTPLFSRAWRKFTLTVINKT